MSYNTKDDLLGDIPEEVLIQLTDDANLGTVDDTKVDQALGNSAAMIDGYCGGVYQLPLDPVPAFIKALDLDIAAYNLYSRRENVPENRKDRYKNAVKTLDAIAAGKISIGAPAASQPPQAGASSLVSAPTRIFDADKLDTYL
jgi:phage gp36-like protein